MKNTNEYEIKEVFNYEDYVKFMKSKVVRTPAMGTFLDYISDKQLMDMSDKSIEDLIALVPNHPTAKKHMNFAFKTWLELMMKFPEDNYLQEIYVNKKDFNSTNWYERFGYKYDENDAS